MLNLRKTSAKLKQVEIEFIEPFHSSWAIPIVLVEKDDSIRFCVNYKTLNNITKDSYPIPRINDAVKTTSGPL